MAGEGIHETEGVNKGRIKDPGVAEELAHLEKPARDREIELQRQAKEGLSERERGNLEIMSGLKEKYPDAFESRVDDKGREVLIMPPVSSAIYHDKVTLLTQERFVTLPTEVGSIDNSNLTGIVDFMAGERDKWEKKTGWMRNDYWIPTEVVLTPGAEYNDAHVYVRQIDLTSPSERQLFKNALQKAQELGEVSKEKQKIDDKAQTPQAVLADL